MIPVYVKHIIFRNLPATIEIFDNVTGPTALLAIKGQTQGYARHDLGVYGFMGMEVKADVQKVLSALL